MVKLLQPLPNTETLNWPLYDFNNASETVGCVEVILNGVETARPAKWNSDGAILPLDVPDPTNPPSAGVAVQVNDLGYSVGSFNDDGAYSLSHVDGAQWTPSGELIVLDSLRPPNSGWLALGSGIGITNTGWIKWLGYYARNGVDISGGAYHREWSMLLPEIGTYGLGDANFDESINFTDLLIVAQNYCDQTNGSIDLGDFNLDGTVNFSDLLVIAQNYGSDAALLPSSASASFISDWNAARAIVPEPNLAIVVAGFSLALRGRTRA